MTPATRPPSCERCGRAVFPDADDNLPDTCPHCGYQGQATRLRALLADLRMGQRQAARLLQIDERTFRRYCAGTTDAPNAVFLALEGLKRR